MKSLFNKFKENKGKNKIKAAFDVYLNKPTEKYVKTPFEKLISRKNHFQYLYKEDKRNVPPIGMYRPKKIEK